MKTNTVKRDTIKLGLNYTLRVIECGECGCKVGIDERLYKERDKGVIFECFLCINDLDTDVAREKGD